MVDRVWDLAGRAVFILLWVGFMAVFRAISDIILAIELRLLGNEAEGRTPEPEFREPAPGAAAASPRIPAQEHRSNATAQSEQRAPADRTTRR